MFNEWSKERIAWLREAGEDECPCWSYDEAQQALDEIERLQKEVEFLQKRIATLMKTERKLTDGID